MPSLFSRSRTTSTPKKSSTDPSPFDEFGRINSRSSARGSPIPGFSTSVTAAAAATLGKKKNKDGKDKSRSRTVSGPAEQEPEFLIPDGSFLPLNLDPPLSTGDPARDQERAKSPSLGQAQTQQQYQQQQRQQPQRPVDYGYLSYGRHVVLGLEEVARLVDVVGDELGRRGLTTPFIFSTLALDVSSAAVKRLIQAFLRTCNKPGREAERQWREEAQFAGPHELGMCLRWGLARVVRIVRGSEVRGLLSYESYVEWREAEVGACCLFLFFSFELVSLTGLM